MPKRSCPFTDSFSTQYKIHVGQKELNLHGVFGNKYRQEVYGKFGLKPVAHIVNMTVNRCKIHFNFVQYCCAALAGYVI